MDITLLQIQNGSSMELMYLKKEITHYLSSKKFSTKSITLVKTLKLIDKEMLRRKNGKINKAEDSSFEILANKPNSSLVSSYSKTPLKIPTYLQDSQKKSNEATLNSMLKRKYKMEEFSRNNSHLLSKLLIVNSIPNTPSEPNSKQDSILKPDKTSEDEFDVFFRESFNGNQLKEDIRSEESDELPGLCSYFSFSANDHDLISTSSFNFPRISSRRNSIMSLSSSMKQNKQIELTSRKRETGKTENDYYLLDKNSFGFNCNISSKSTDGISCSEHEADSCKNLLFNSKSELGLKERNIDKFEGFKIENFFD